MENSDKLADEIVDKLVVVLALDGSDVSEGDVSIRKMVEEFLEKCGEPVATEQDLEKLEEAERDFSEIRSALMKMPAFMRNTAKGIFTKTMRKMIRGKLCEMSKDKG